MSASSEDLGASNQKGVLAEIWDPVSSWLISWMGIGNRNLQNNEKDFLSIGEDEKIASFVQAGFDGNEEELNRLFRAGVNVNARLQSTGTTALYLACLNGHKSAVELLLKIMRADPTIADDEGTAPIHVSAYLSSGTHIKDGSRDEIITMLVSEFEVDVNECDLGGGTPLLMAALSNSCSALRTLLALGADSTCVNSRGESALYLSAQEGNNDVVRILLEEASGTNLDVVTSSGGWTPLFAAAQNGRYSTTELLLSRGASVLILDNVGNSPVHVAAMEGFPYIVKILCAHGADSNATNEDGDTPVLMATKDGHNDVIQVLVTEYGADTCLADNQGYTPAYVAAQEGLDTTLSLLVDLGADPTATNTAGDSPIDAALQQGHSSTVALLQELKKEHESTKLKSKAKSTSEEENLLCCDD